MIKVIMDNQLQLTEATTSREETAYVRGTVVETVPGLEALQYKRVRMYADATPECIDWVGKALEISAIPGKPVKYEGSDQLTYNLNDVELIAEMPAAYKAKHKQALAIAALQAGLESGARVITSKTPGSVAEAAKAGELEDLLVAAGDDL